MITYITSTEEAIKKARNVVKLLSATFFIAMICSTSFAEAPWKFIACGDSQGFDLGVNTTILSELATEAINQDVEIFLCAGDLISGYWGYESELAIWRAIMQPVYDANISVYVVRGNHEEDSGEVNIWQSVFNYLPNNGPPGETKLTYSVTHKNSFIVGLDQYVNLHRVNQEWLDTQLVTNIKPHVFFFGHEPAFKTAHYDCLDDYPADRNLFWESIKKAGGRTYFCGHDHFYDHARVEDGDGDPNNDIHQYISGTAGALFYNILPEPYNGNNSYFTVEQWYHARRYGYILVEIDGPDVTLTWMQRDSNDLDFPGTYEPNDVWNYTITPLQLLAPNGCETIVAGSTYPVIWTTYDVPNEPNIDYVLIEYSDDNGTNWNDIGIQPNTGSYEWDVPTVDSNQCLVRVSDLYNPTINDTSYDMFTIFQCQGPITGDLNGDCYVDFFDFTVIAGHWLECGNRFDPACGIE